MSKGQEFPGSVMTQVPLLSKSTLTVIDVFLAPASYLIDELMSWCLTKQLSGGLSAVL